MIIRVNVISGSTTKIGLNAWSYKVISIVLKLWGCISLKITEDTWSIMILPIDPEIGRVYRILLGMLYLEDIRLQQKIILFMGVITGVNVDKYWIFEALAVSG